MYNEYVAPEYQSDAFNCPYCDSYAHQIWYFNVFGDHNGRALKFDNVDFALCQKCNQYSIWYDEKLIYPIMTTAPLPSPDMPEEVKRDYNEARDIFEISPKASAALLRLAIQKLCIYLGEHGRNINEDIASLVSKGLPIRIQRALDTVRVVGNNAVHPGEINIDDNPSIALSLFKLLNLIVDVMVTQPNEIDELFESLPEGALEAIERRDRT